MTGIQTTSLPFALDNPGSSLTYDFLILSLPWFLIAKPLYGDGSQTRLMQVKRHELLPRADLKQRKPDVAKELLERSSQQVLDKGAKVISALFDA